MHESLILQPIFSMFQYVGDQKKSCWKDHLAVSGESQVTLYKVTRMVVSGVCTGGSCPCRNVIGQLRCQSSLYPLVPSESTRLTGGYFNPCPLPSLLPNLPILKITRETTEIISH